MSNERIPVSLNHAERAKWRRGIAACKKTTHPAYRIVTVLEDMMSRERNGEAFPSQAALSAFTGISVRDLRRHTKALADDGWLEVLDGKDRTRPKSKRGSHYRPTWPDEETKTRCMNNEFIQNSDDEDAARTGSPAPVSKARKTGQACPVSDDVKTGHLASQNRPSKVAKPAMAGRSHRRDGGTTDKTTEGKPPYGGFPHQSSDNNSIGEGAAFAGASGPHIGEEREDTFTAGDPSFDGREDFSAGDPPTADEANSVFAEAFEALCKTGDDLSLAGHDRHRGNADDKSSAGGNQNADADRSDDDADDASRADDLLRACIERIGDLAGDDQRRVQAMEKRRSAGRTLEEGEINTLAMMHRRLRDRADDFTWQDLRTNEAMKKGKRP